MLCTPEQFKGRIGYFIFVDRFCRGNESPLNPVEGRILKDWEDSVRRLPRRFRRQEQR